MFGKRENRHQRELLACTSRYTVPLVLPVTDSSGVKYINFGFDCLVMLGNPHPGLLKKLQYFFLENFSCYCNLVPAVFIKSSLFFGLRFFVVIH